MSSQPVRTPSTTGLPPGVLAGPLGRRFVAQLIDAVVPVLVIAVAGAAGSAGVSVVAAMLVAAWLVLGWWMFATRAAGPGMRLMKLQLVGLRDGRPIGFGRFFLRALVLAALTITVVGLLVMLVFLLQQLRKQGWHDLAADSVVIKERALAPVRHPAPARVAASGRSAPTSEVDPGPVVGGQTPAGPVPAAAAVPAAVAVSPVTAGPSLDGAGFESPLGTADSVRIGPRPPAGPPAMSVSSLGTEDTRPKDVGWVAVLDDGREIGVAGLVLLGRNPKARPGEDDAELIKVADETRTVSKTHLALSVDGAGLTVMDRGSTNGTTLTDPTGVSVASPAGDVVDVGEGSIISFGDHWLKIEHRG